MNVGTLLCFSQNLSRFCRFNGCLFFLGQHCLRNQFFSDAEVLTARNGDELVRFFLLTFAAAIPAAISYAIGNGLVAINFLISRVGGANCATGWQNESGFVYKCLLAGLIAVCVDSD